MISKHPDHSARERFISELKEFHVSCGGPPYRKLTEMSEELTSLYGDRGLPTLSATAISEVLAGRRKGLPSAAWLASFVLSCQRRAWETGVTARDPGIDTLPDWQARLCAAHTIPAPENPAVPARSRPDTVRPGPHTAVLPLPDPDGRESDDPFAVHRAAGYPTSAVRLPSAQYEHVARYGPVAWARLADMRAGVPEAVYEVALLLGAEPEHGETAHALLISAVADEHPRALDLLEAGTHGSIDATVAAGHALELAGAAHAERATDIAEVYYECAARYHLLDTPDEPRGRFAATGRPAVGDARFP